MKMTRRTFVGGVAAWAGLAAASVGWTVDTGDPDAECVNEPRPNGKCGGV